MDTQGSFHGKAHHRDLTKAAWSPWSSSWAPGPDRCGRGPAHLAQTVAPVCARGSSTPSQGPAEEPCGVVGPLHGGLVLTGQTPSLRARCQPSTRRQG